VIEILRLDNGKAVHIDGNEITAKEAIEIATKLTKTWGTDLDKDELREYLFNLALELKGDC